MWAIELIKRIKSSLTLKIFAVTTLLLILCCALTYGFIAWLMPKTYSANLNAVLNQKVYGLISSLEKTPLDESMDLFDLFVMSNNVVIQLHNSLGQQISVPTNMNAVSYYNTDNTVNVTAEEFPNASSREYTADGTEVNIIQQSASTTIAESVSIDKLSIDNLSAMSAAQQYQLKFSDSNEQYTLTVLGNAQAVNQVMETLRNIAPWLILVILFMSAAASFIYSRFVTYPVIKLSAVSKKMAKLDLDWQCDENRNDELGILAHSLNNLSGKLSASLSELRDANIKLQDDIEKEKKLDQARLEFFSAVSHELKTPVTIIKGQLEGMLLGVGTYKDRDKYLSRSLEVVLSLESMVQEILTVSRMESSGFVLRIEELDFSEMLKKQLSTYEDLIVKKSLQLRIDIEDYLFIAGDKAMLQKVINNLVINAIHYSPAEHHIFIKAWRTNSNVNFIIENTGVHVPETDLPKLFEAFYRVEQSRNRQTGGSGLGLYIVKMILDQHKADYKLENTAAGVQFSVSFEQIFKAEEKADI